MRIIAHRGLIDGPNKSIENRPKTIENALGADFDSEVDIWRVGTKWFLGHIELQYPVSSNWIMSVAPRAWFHCKNSEAMLWMANHSRGVNFFWHGLDDYTLTSAGYVWAYPGSKVEGNTILVLPERIMEIHEIANINCYGVCTDFSLQVREGIG